MIAVDTNVIAYLWIPGAHTANAELLLKKDSEWIAPLLWRSEFRNVIAGYIRRKLMTLETAVQVMEEAESQMRGKEYAVSSTHVLNLAKKTRCSAYDCEFVALAEDVGVPLVTTDRKILSAFPSIAASLKKFSAS
jgi:predicted nucleic acid-binding protein